MPYKPLKIIETGFMGGTVSTGDRMHFPFEDLKIIGYDCPERLEEFAKIANNVSFISMRKFSDENGIILPVEQYTASDRTLMGRFFVRLPKNEKGRYQYMEVDKSD